MTNCPNCSGLLKPDSCKCEFCGSYFFDFCGINFEEHKPFFMHIKTQQGVATMKVLPGISTFEETSEPTYITDTRHNTIVAMYYKCSASLHVDFDCVPMDNNGTLVKFDTGAADGKM